MLTYSLLRSVLLPKDFLSSLTLRFFSAIACSRLPTDLSFRIDFDVEAHGFSCFVQKS